MNLWQVEDSIPHFLAGLLCTHICTEITSYKIHTHFSSSMTSRGVKNAHKQVNIFENMLRN